MDAEHTAKLIDSGLALASELSLEAVLRRIVQLGMDITGARYGALGVLDERGRILEFVTEGITQGQREAIGDPPTGRGILGLLIRDGGALRIEDVSKDPRAHGFPPNHPPMRSFLGAPVIARGRVFGRIYLTDKRGDGEFGEDDERATVVLAAQAGVAVENARLHEEARRRERWLAATLEVGSLIMSGAGAFDALQRIATRARELVDADLSTIATPGPGARELTITVATGDRAEELIGLSFPRDGSISGVVMRTRRAELIDDLSADPRAARSVVRLGMLGPAACVPLPGREEAFGTLLVANERGGHPFDQESLSLVETFAAQAAVALEFERSNREHQRLTVLEDRERIAKELHDGVIQSLFAVGMGLEGTVGLAKDEDIARRIESAAEEIDRAIRDLRSYIFGLRPGILADRELDQALRELAEEFSDRTEVVLAVDIDTGVAAELAPLATDVVQITREALSNVGRHAAAATCRVSLRRNRAGTAILEVDDDGKGFDTSVTANGMGLANLRERVEALGGTLEVASVLGEGTMVRATLPL
ncbi:MAG: GAF domain-containing sensor histidine kinase [Actinobacteria bacterium]|nr:GAF domain-containing sensor histidine kinase [Actinomycetota bacterium]